MDLLPTIANLAWPVTIVVLLSWLLLRLRQRSIERRSSVVREDLDTVAAWPPEATRVLTVGERQAYDLVRRAMPGFLVLAQVPLSRFVRVPTRQSYAEWLNRVGLLSADLMLCDSGSRVLAVIDVRAPQESDRARRRHERMSRVLGAAGIPVITWREDTLPSLGDARRALAALAGSATPKSTRTADKKPTLDELLAPGDLAPVLSTSGTDEFNEPVSSAFFEELENSPTRR